MPLIPGLWRQRQADLYEFKAILSILQELLPGHAPKATENFCLEKPKKKKKRKEKKSWP